MKLRHSSTGGPATVTLPSALAAATSAFIASACAFAGTDCATAAVARTPAIASRRVRPGRFGMLFSEQFAGFGHCRIAIVRDEFVIVRIEILLAFLREYPRRQVLVLLVGAQT